MTLTTDTSLITRVYASISYNDIFPEIDPDETDELPDDFDARVSNALSALARAIESRYPNAIDILIESTGWDGDYAQFTPRADNPDLDLSDEFFFDWLNSVCESIA